MNTGRHNHLQSWVVALCVCALAACSTGVRKPQEGERIVTHRVEYGETLEDIALEYYGERDRAHDIEKFNDMDNDDIHEGATVRIPLTPKERGALERRESARKPYNEGLAQVERGMYLDATQSFQRALELNPDFAEAHYNLGVTYQRMKAFDRAEDEYRDALKERPKDPNYRYALGAVLYYQEKYPGAIEWFEKTLDVAPAHLKALYSLARAYEKNHQMTKARRAWQRYLDLDATSEWATEARQRLDALQ